MTTVIPAQSPGLATARQVPRAPLPTTGVTFCCVMSCITSEGATPPSSLIRTHAPDQVPLTGSSCPYSDESLSAAADCQPLLGIGPSRHYLCNLCIGAWTPIPQRLFGAFTRFFPKSNGLTSGGTSSARLTNPVMQLQQGILFRDGSHSFMFRLPYSIDPQVAPTAAASSSRAAGPFNTTHSSVGYLLPRDVASLRVQHE
jgi:hypothetical protein